MSSAKSLELRERVDGSHAATGTTTSSDGLSDDQILLRLGKKPVLKVRNFPSAVIHRLIHLRGALVLCQY